MSEHREHTSVHREPVRAHREHTSRNREHERGPGGHERPLRSQQPKREPQAPPGTDRRSPALGAVPAGAVQQPDQHHGRPHPRTPRPQPPARPGHRRSRSDPGSGPAAPAGREGPAGWGAARPRPPPRLPARSAGRNAGPSREPRGMAAALRSHPIPAPSPPYPLPVPSRSDPLLPPPPRSREYPGAGTSRPAPRTRLSRCGGSGESSPTLCTPRSRFAFRVHPKQPWDDRKGHRMPPPPRQTWRRQGSVPALQTFFCHLLHFSTLFCLLQASANVLYTGQLQAGPCICLAGTWDEHLALYRSCHPSFHFSLPPSFSPSIHASIPLHPFLPPEAQSQAWEQPKPSSCFLMGELAHILSQEISFPFFY